MSIIGDWMRSKGLRPDWQPPDPPPPRPRSDFDAHDLAIIALARRYAIARTFPQPVGYVQSLEARLLNAARAWAMPGDPPERAESIEVEPWPGARYPRRWP